MQFNETTNAIRESRFMKIGALCRAICLVAGTAAVVMTGCVDNGARGAASNGSGGARLLVATGDSVQWGTVAPGSLVDTVVVTNIGDDTLKITNVKPSCGCTSAPIDKSTLLPGDSAHIIVTMDAKDKSGAVHKTLTISSNDSAAPNKVIPLMATIIRDVVAEPTLFPVVTTKHTGEEGTTSVVVKNQGQTTLTVGPPQLVGAAPMVVSFAMKEPVQLAPGDSTTVTATVRTIQNATAVGTVSIPTSSKIIPEIQLTMTAQISPNM